HIIQFLVDSGADVSIIPPQAKSKIIKMSDFKLYAANGTEIPTFGVHVLNINLGLRRDFRWPFIIAKVNRGILGADFLHCQENHNSNRYLSHPDETERQP
ncbi:hypothetical protein, partial [Klebsiella pneumoniae]|uniref:hypothetical protein n=1 Tax=Klebsiella pneumoniae TaxID=573 RepID=UPI0040559455